MAQAVAACEMSKSRPPLSKKLQACVLRRDKWICRWCDRPVIFPPVMRLIECEVRAAGNGAPLAYHHAHWTRANAPLLDMLGAVIDHVAAYSTGGPTAKENLATACNKCNTQKSAGSSERHLKLHPLKPIKSKYGEPQHWDGLSALFVLLAQRDPSVLTASEKDWLRVLTGATTDAH
jgi:5-methylcytosine-specific restriction endonuclease McrA